MMELIGQMVIFLAMTVFTSSAQAVEKSNLESAENFGDMIQYRDGHIIVAVLIPIGHRDMGTGRCINELNSYGTIAVEQLNMVIDQVNKNDDLLKGIKLGILTINTCGSEAHALEKLVINVLKTYVIEEGCLTENCSDNDAKRILAGVVGAGRSSVSLELARILQVFRISQISAWSTNPDLSDKTRFKNFFRTVPPDTYQTLAMAEFAKESGWNYASVVYADDQYGVTAYRALTDHLLQKEICVAAEIRLDMTKHQFDADEIVKQLLRKSEAKVVFLIAGTYHAELIMKAAYNIPEARTTFTWIGADSWSGLLPTDITDDSYQDTLDGAIGFNPKTMSAGRREDRLTSLTLEERQGEYRILNPWWEHFIAHTKNCTLDNTDSEKRSCAKNETINLRHVLDTRITPSLMAYVHALDSYLGDVCGNLGGLCNEIAATAGTNKVACELYEYIKNVSFPSSEGGTFEFDQNQDGPLLYDIKTFDRSLVVNDSTLAGWTDTAIFDSNGVTWKRDKPKTMEIVSNCSATCGRGQAKVPREQICCWSCLNCTRKQYVHEGSECKECFTGYLPNKIQDGCVAMPVKRMKIGAAYTLGIVVTGAFGLICTLIVTAIYLKYRDTAIVKASGKELCFFVLFGVFATLLNCISICVIPSPVSCGIIRVILSIGPVCMYGGLLMKTIRVVFIFQSKGILSTRTKAYLEPRPLLLITVLVCSVQGVISAIWLSVNVPEEKIYYSLEEGFLSCKHLLDVQIFVGLAYPFAIIMICTVLATINRNAPTGFRETLFIGFTMYVTCVTWIAFLPLFLTNSIDIPKKITTLSVALSISAITVLFCLFGPRCYTMLAHPDMNTEESVMAPEGSTISASLGSPYSASSMLQNQINIHLNLKVKSFSTVPRRRTVTGGQGVQNPAWCPDEDDVIVKLRCRTTPT